MKIKIPFKEQFHSLILNRIKTTTVRTKKYGKVGDYFTISVGFIKWNIKFYITDIIKLPLSEAVSKYWKRDGFASPDEFKEFWKTIHPSGYKPDLKVYVHFFIKENG